MNKWTLLNALILFALIFTFAGCGDNTDVADPATSTASTATTQAEFAALTKAAVPEGFRTGGSGSKMFESASQKEVKLCRVKIVIF